MLSKNDRAEENAKLCIEILQTRT